MQLSIAEPEQSAELRDAFLQHLPQRLKTLLRRARAQSRSGWDINVLHMMQDEVSNLAGACGRYGQLELGERLLALESVLTPWSQSQQVPDSGAGVRIDLVLDGLRPYLEQGTSAYPRPALRVVPAEPAPAAEPGLPHLHETPPAGHWRTLGAPDFEPPPAANEPAPPVISMPAVPLSAADGRSVYLLGGGDDPLLNELAMRMESRGCTVTPIEDAASLIEVLGALPPQLVVVGAEHSPELDRIGPALRAARASASHKVAMLALLANDDVAPRLRALRAGADRCMAHPSRPEDVLARALDLLSNEDDEPYRILIVEDDASQALFAESILRKAGMVTQVLNEPIAVLEELDRFQPDLLLMDLNMPGCDGLELTALIREREAYVSTPIVFLSGDPDADRQFAALDAGGDDFLSKPIRPKYLVSAVTNRVRRARASVKHARDRRRRDPVTGLHERKQLLDALNERFAAAGGGALRGGVVCIEIDGANALRGQVGLTVLDELLADVGTFIAHHVERDEMVARFGDAGFLMFSPQRDESALTALARNLRTQIANERFGNKAVPIGIGCGVCAFDGGLPEVGAVLAAAERALDAARHDGSGIGVYSKLNAVESGMRAQLESALHADAFHLIFQPIAPLVGGGEPQYQALLRLRDSASGELYSAAQLVPEATRVGLIGAIDDWVLHHCIGVLAERERGGGRLRLFVSQSLQGWNDAARLAALRQRLPVAGIARGSLTLEFRYEEACTQLQTLIDLAPGLRELGIKLSLAGVGREAVSTGLLEHLPLDFVKLSHEVNGDGSDLGVLVQTAHEHGRQVIAPRVEDAAAAVRLCAAGVDFLQGNFVQQAGQALDYDFSSAQQ